MPNLSIGDCPERKRLRSTPSALFEVALQSVSQEKFSCLLGGGSVTVCQMRVFAVANETGRGGVSVVAVAAFDIILF